MRHTFNLMDMWTHKTVGSGAQRILEWFMKSHCMHNEPLFGADFGLAEWMGVLFRKWGQKCSNSEWRMLSQHDNGIFVASIGRYGYGRHVVSAGRRNLSRCAWNNWVVVRKFSWPCHLTQWRSELATKVVRFDTVWLLSLGVCEISCMCQQTTTIPELKVEIRCIIGENELQLCGNVIKRFVIRARVCQQSHGGHLSDIVFHN